MPLQEGMCTQLAVPQTPQFNRCERIWLEATFSSGAATVTDSSHSGITMTRDASTGVYDLVLPVAGRYINGNVMIIDATADQAGIATVANWEALNPSAGTASIRFLESEGELDDIAPANSTTVLISLDALSG